MSFGPDRYDEMAAREDERRRIADDLHDGLQQLVFGAMQHTATARWYVTRDPDRAVEALSWTRDLLEEVLSELRRTVLKLRPQVLEERGLLTALHQLAAMHQEISGVSARIVVDPGSAPLPALVELAAYRIAQEALANVQKHAQARNVRVLVGWSRAVFRMDVEDDGCGIASDRPRQGEEHVGLRSMEERATSVGGWVAVTSAGEGLGTRVSLQVPLARVPAEAAVARVA